MTSPCPAESDPDSGELRWPWNTLYFPSREVIHNPEFQWIRASSLVQVFYVLLLFQAVGSYNAWLLMLDREGAQPLWSVLWVQAMSWSEVVFFVGLLYFFGAVLAALYPSNAFARFLALLGVFLFDSLKYSFGKIDHNNHLLVGVAAILIFLPRAQLGGANRARNQRRYLEVFWGAQAFILLAYTHAGISKLHGAVIDLIMDRRSLFSIEALGSHIAHDFVSRGKESGLGIGEFIIDNAWLGGGLFWGAVALELFSFAIAWKPRLQRLWGICLIGLHVGIGLAMEIWFRPPILLLGIFLLASPFAPPYRVFALTLRDIPWIGPFLCGLRAEIRSQRRKSESEIAENDRITIYLRSGWRFENSIRTLLSETNTYSRFRVSTMESPEYRELVTSFPYLQTPQFIVVESGHFETYEIRVGAEACLWTLAHLRHSCWRNGFVLLLLPNFLLESALARTSRSNSSCNR